MEAQLDLAVNCRLIRQLCWVQDNDEFWMYDELKTRVVDPHALRNKYTKGLPTVKDKDSDKMIASRSAHVSAASGLPCVCVSACIVCNSGMVQRQVSKLTINHSRLQLCTCDSRIRYFLALQPYVQAG